MNVNPETINQYVEDTKVKIDLIHSDIQSYEYRIKQSKKEIATLELLLSQFNKTLEILSENES